MRQSLEHADHVGKVVEAIDGVHDFGVVRACLHVANNRVAVFIVAPTTVELAREAVRAIANIGRIRPSRTQRQVRIGKWAVDHAALVADFAAAGALAVAAEAGDGVKERRVGHVDGVGVDAPVPVRLHPLEAAFSAQQVLVQLHIPAVPWEEVGHEVDLRVEGIVRVHQVVHARGDGVDPLVLLLGQLAQAHGGTEVLSLLGLGELAPLLADGRVGAGAVCSGDGARGSGRREGEDGEGRSEKHRGEERVVNEGRMG